MEIIHVEASVRGRVVVIRRDPKRLLIGFHGYGETAEVHAAELQQIPGAEAWTIVAVQALHPFYIRSDQRVVGSWMTSLDRELAIEDNLGYVRNVLGEFPARERLVFAGFSQGASMAYRAAAESSCNGLISLGGDLPDDVVPKISQLPRILIGRGETDEWFTAEKLKNNLRSLDRHPVEVVEFAGGHEWSAAFRQRAGTFLSSVG